MTLHNKRRNISNKATCCLLSATATSFITSCTRAWGISASLPGFVIRRSFASAEIGLTTRRGKREGRESGSGESGREGESGRGEEGGREGEWERKRVGEEENGRVGGVKEERRR